jgi:chromosome partitioning protein
MTDGNYGDAFAPRSSFGRSALEQIWSRYDASVDGLTSTAFIAREPHVITFANEKGGVGKSTSAFHTAIALCNAGESVAIIDLDFRQRSLAKAVENRAATARRLAIDFPCPVNDIFDTVVAGALSHEIRRLGRTCDFIIIDVAGHDSEIARVAVSIADTLVTPMNDSFVDLELLGHFDADDMQLATLGPFASLVKNLATNRGHKQARSLDWVVLRNRIRSLASQNERRFSEALSQVAPIAGFRIGSGLSERVVYREFYPFGLTLLDGEYLPDLRNVRQVAKDEMHAMLSSLRLPEKAHLPQPVG